MAMLISNRAEPVCVVRPNLDHRPRLQSWCVNDLIPIRLAETRLQATDDFCFEGPPGNGRFLSQPTMKLLRQANADHPTPRAFHQRKASDDRSKGNPDNQATNGGNGETPHRTEPTAQ
jgi:hypothetical protein